MITINTSRQPNIYKCKLSARYVTLCGDDGNIYNLISFSTSTLYTLASDHFMFHVLPSTFHEHLPILKILKMYTILPPHTPTVRITIISWCWSSSGASLAIHNIPRPTCFDQTSIIQTFEKVAISPICYFPYQTWCMRANSPEANCKILQETSERERWDYGVWFGDWSGWSSSN